MTRRQPSRGQGDLSGGSDGVKKERWQGREQRAPVGHTGAVEGREGMRGGRDRGMEKRKGGRKGGREGGREGGSEGGRERGRKGNLHSTLMNQADIVKSVTVTYTVGHVGSNNTHQEGICTKH